MKNPLSLITQTAPLENTRGAVKIDMSEGFVIGKVINDSDRR